ncbi:MAG: MFS transporter, partial [Spirochaetaceae bacterium]|nr:MFS transporter [Spirochaetaceae bacterium]
MSIFREYRSLPGPIWAMAGARMVNAIGSFVYPFLTLLLTDKLGFNESNAGRILMIATVMFVPGSLIGGWLADRVGRKRLLITAQIIGALSLVVAGLMPLTPAIIWPILVQNFFFGLMMPASSAITYDLTGPENRKTAFSLLYLAMNLGFAAGPLLAGYLYESHAKWLFLGDAGTTLLSLIFIIALVPETLSLAQGVKPDNTELMEQPQKGAALPLLLKRPILLTFVLMVAVPWFIYGQHSFTLPIFSKELYPETGALLYGKMMSFNALIVVVFTVPIISFTRKFRPVTNVALNAFLYAVGFGMLAFFHSP